VTLDSKKTITRVRALVVVSFLLYAPYYLIWRLGTFNPESPFFSWLIWSAEVFGYLTAVLHIFMVSRLTSPVATLPPKGLTVDVFVPTYNESVNLLRHTLLAATRMEYPHQTWLLDDGNRPEMAALAEELEASSDGETTAWTIQTNDPYHYNPVMNSFGGYVFAETDAGYDPNDVGLDSEGALAAGAWLQEMAEAGHLQPDVDYDVMHAMFTGGQVACIGTGPWALSMIRDSGVAYTINAFPSGGVQAGRPFLGVQGFMVSAFSENQLLAQTVLSEVFSTTEFMQAMYDADPRPSAYLAVRESTTDEDLAAFATAGADGMPMPAIPEMSSVWEAWTNAITLTITQQQDSAEAFATAADQVRTLIAE